MKAQQTSWVALELRGLELPTLEVLTLVCVVGCSSCWLAITVGVSVNKLIAGRGEKRGPPVDPKRADKLKSPVVEVRAAGGVLCARATAGIGGVAISVATTCGSG